MELTLIKESNKTYTLRTPMCVYGELTDIKQKDVKELVRFLENIGHFINKPKYWRNKK